MALNADLLTGTRRERPAALFDEVAGAGSPGQRAVLANVVADAAARGTWTADQVRDVGLRALGDGALLAELGAASPTYVLCLTALAHADQYSAVIGLAERGLEIGERHGSRIAIAYSLAMHAGVLLRTGRLVDSEQSASRVTEELAEADPIAYGISVGFLVQSLVDQGRVEDAREALTSSGMDGDLPAFGTVAFLMMSRGHLYLAENDPERAEAEFLRVGRIAIDSSYTNPAALAWRSGLALARLALGRTEDAVSVATAEVDLARRFGAGRATAVALFVLARCVVSTEERAALVRESLSEAQCAGAQLDEARAMLELASLQMSSGDVAGARSSAESALDLAERCDASRVADSALDLLRQTGAKPRRRQLRGVEALTHQERRVAVRAAAGSRNTEIADELFVTVGTVEAHLTNVYKKLGVASRDELPEVLAADS